MMVIQAMKKTLGTVFVIALLSTPITVNAQALDLSNLNPQVVAATSCSGTLTGLALSNYDIGVYTEERAKDLIHGAVLYAFSVALHEESEEHMQQYGESYASFEQTAMADVVDKVSNGLYTWDDQNEVDKCVARMTKVITSPFPEFLQSEQRREALRESTNERFDVLKSFAEAME